LVGGGLFGGGCGGGGGWGGVGGGVVGFLGGGLVGGGGVGGGWFVGGGSLWEKSTRVGWISKGGRNCTRGSTGKRLKERHHKNCQKKQQKFRPNKTQMNLDDRGYTRTVAT